jgi:hypothetical protein
MGRWLQSNQKAKRGRAGWRIAVRKVEKTTRSGKGRVAGRVRRAQEEQDTRHVTWCEASVILSVHVELTSALFVGEFFVRRDSTTYQCIYTVRSIFRLCRVCQLASLMKSFSARRNGLSKFWAGCPRFPPNAGKNFPRPSAHLQFRDQSIEALHTISTKMIVISVRRHTY